MANRVYFGAYDSGELYFSTPAGRPKTDSFHISYRTQAQQLGIAAPQVPADLEVDAGRESLINDLVSRARRVGADVVARSLGRRPDSAKIKGLWILLKMGDDVVRDFQDYRNRNPEEQFLYVD